MAERPARIYVLAGINGAGKSSIGGAMLLESGTPYFDPDEAARRIRSVNPGATQGKANSAAWNEGKRLLERAIDESLDFAFETALGGRTIATLLARAAARGIEVRVWYVGLRDVRLHLARVRERVSRGGHDIPQADVRRRWESSRLNLIHLLPELTELYVYDNSAQADPAAGATPQPLLLVHLRRGKLVAPRDLSATPAWAKPLVAAAILLDRRRASRPSRKRS